MAPSSIFVNNQQTFIPGVYTSINASGLNGTNVQASGIVALIGMANGGTPYSAIKLRSDFPTFESPADVARYFGSGGLVEAANICFAPSNDAAILGGAQQIVCLNVVPSTQATLTLSGGGTQALSLAAKQWGTAGNAVSVLLGAGTTAGASITITNGTSTEYGNNIGTPGFASLSASSSAYSATWDISGNLTVKSGATVVFTLPATATVATLAATVAANAAGGAISFTYANTAFANTLLSQLDHVNSTNLANVPLALGNVSSSLANWITANSQLVTATFLVTASTPPTTSSATFFTGGTTSVPTFTDWQNCLNLLQQVRVNTVVPLTCDPSVAIATTAHCDYMCGAGQSERDCVIGIQNPALSGLATLAQILSQTLAINSRHTRCCPQSLNLYNSQGVQTTLTPAFTAAAVAGMQAGAGVGVSLTHKTVNALAVLQDPSWSPMTNANLMLQSGALIFEQKDNIGIRVIRNITSYQVDSNAAYTEASVNQAVDYVAYNVRTNLQIYVGKPNFSGTTNAIQAAVDDILSKLVVANVIVAYANLSVTSVGDQAIVSFSVAPIQPTNFIPVQIQVVQASLLAA